MGNGCYVPDAGNIKSGTLKRADSRLTSASRALDIYLHLAQAMYHGFSRGVPGCHLGSERSAFA